MALLRIDLPQTSACSTGCAIESMSVLRDLNTVSSGREFFRNTVLGRKLFREPLVQFVAVGAAIYLAFGLIGKPGEAPSSDKTVVVEAAEIEWMQTSWQQRWNRLPTDEELDSLIQQYIRETILYREALALELDRDDAIVRRRMVQKMEFLARDLAAMAPVTEAELQEYFTDRRDAYQPPTSYTFTQVFFNPDKRGDAILEEAEAAKAQLSSQPDAIDRAGELGDMLLQNYYPRYSQLDIEKQFGTGFAASLVDLSPQQWHGPILSGYGVHLVYVHAINESAPVRFADVRDRVRQNWEDELRESINEEFYQTLRDRYTIVIDKNSSATPVEERTP